MLKIWKKISSRVALKNNYWTYLIDEFTIDGIKKHEYHFVQTRGSTMIIPITDQGKFIMVNQYRYLNEKFSLEFPCGSIEEGIDKFSNAKKELEEETGFTSEKIKEVSFFNPYNGVTDEICYVFEAWELSKVESHHDETEQFEIMFLTKSEIEEKIRTNEIWDGMSLAAWYQYKTINEIKR